MPNVAEQDPVLTQKLLPKEKPVSVQPALGQAALRSLELVAIGHFYGSDEQFTGNTPDGEHSINIGSSSGGTTKRETVGTGKDIDSALHDSLERMRTLETVRTRSLAHIEMTDSTFASFTTLEHYNPKVAPSKDIYSVPSYLEATLTDSGSGDHTYRKTIENEGWQTEVRSLLADYLASDPAGQQLAAGLKIRSLNHLTPEQAVKLSASFVQNVSRYTKADVASKELTRADQSTTLDLLKEGIANRQDPEWKGNGVCRNVASNVKVVFEALKQTQGELSMLNNTYCVYGAGADGAGYADSRADAFTTNIGDRSGHAWNTFVTVDSKGSAVATIIDATWALDKGAGEAIKHLDRTEVRAAAQLMQLFEKSEAKAEAFYGLTDYVQRLIRTSQTNPQLSQSGREGVREYVTTEYLKAAVLLTEIPEAYSLPDAVVGSAYRMRGKLEQQEVATLYVLDKASGGIEQERIKAVIAGYDSQRQVSIPGWMSAENLVFADSDLQTLAYEAVGQERVQQLAGLSGKFRARLRELKPEALPPFDASERLEDAQELSYFAGQNGIHYKDPRMIMKQFSRALKRLAGDDNVYNAIVSGRSDYELARDFSSIAKALRNKSIS